VALKCWRSPKTPVSVHFSSYRSVIRRSASHVTRNVTWPEVTSFDRKWPGKGCRRQNLAFWVRFSSYRAVTRSRCQSRDRNDVTWLEVTSFDRKWAGKGCRRPKPRNLGAFQLLQAGCCSVQWVSCTQCCVANAVGLVASCDVD